MTRRWIVLSYAAIGWAAAIVGGLGAIVLRVVDPVPPLTSTFGFGDIALSAFAVLGIAFASVGAVLVVRRPGNVIGWFMVLIGVGYAVGIFWAAVTYSLAAHPSVVSWLDVRWAAWLTVLFTSLGGAVFALGFIFPTGRGHTPRWDRALKAAAVVTPVMFLTVFLLRPGPLHVFPTIDNPIGIGPDLRPWLGDHVSARVSAMAVVLLPFVVWSIVSRYRLAAQVERQQLKWFGLATAATIATLALAGFSASLSNRPPEIGLALFGFAGAFVPLSIGIAILRYRLYDIDRLISRTLGYAIITGLLALVFLGLIALLLAFLATFAQDLVPFSSGRTLAVALATLVVFALFQPIRHRVQGAVDRRFDRARYDTQRMADAFAGRLRDEVDIATVTADLDATVRAAVRPTTLGLWVRGPR